MITGKETVVGVAVPTTAVVGSEALTAVDIFNYVLGGVTVGGWLQIGAILTVIIILALNSIKLYKTIKEMWYSKDIDADDSL